MTVTCPSCHASLTIPDDRLPKGKVVSAACPQCKGKIVIDLTGVAPAPTAASGPAAPPAPSLSHPATPAPAPSPAPPPAAQPPTPAEPEATEAYGEQQQPRALVCVSDQAEREQVLAALRQLGFATQVAEDAADATQRLRFTAFAATILRDGFGSPAGDENPVLDFLAETRMAMRRLTHVVFVSPNVHSHDSALAFAKSVPLVLHVNDLPHLADALKRSREETERLQHVLVECLRAVGKG